jgi:hypothetical protein
VPGTVYDSVPDTFSVPFLLPGRRAGPAKGVAVELAAQLADLSSRAIGEHYGIGAAAVPANHARLTARAELLEVVERLSTQLRKRKLKRN